MEPSARHKLQFANNPKMLVIMIVITIILILEGISASRYERSVIRAKEATLKQDLFTMRNAIQQYTHDKKAGPSSIDDLVPKYLSTVPVDPMTRNRDWQTTPGITDVHSRSIQTFPFGKTAYNTW
jgi:general secretion pathway protein G